MTARVFNLLIFTNLALLLGLFLWPNLSLAATGNSYEFLDSSVFGLNNSQSLNFIDYAKLIYQTILSIVVVLSIIQVAIGGMEYIASGAGGAKGDGKQRITNALLGLLIALASYLILSTIDPSFVKFNLTLDAIQTTSIPTPGNGNGGGGGLPGNPGNGGGTGGNHQYPSGVGLTEDEARNQLADKNVKINNDGRICGGLTYDQYKVQHNGLSCTNLDGLSQESIDQIIQLKRDCNCEVMITGGTEAGHSAGGTYGAHAPGGTAIDINRNGNTALDNYIQSGTYLGLSGNRPIYQIGGRKYWREDSAHWHSY